MSAAISTTNPHAVQRARTRRQARVYTNATEGTPFDEPEPSVTRARTEELVPFLLWLIAVVLVIAGIVALVRGAILYGLVLIIVGLLVGPGGVSIFT
jgi:Flp pilus assembly protein TadB